MPKRLLRPSELVGRIVELRREIVTKGGQRFEAGTEWRVYSYWRGFLTLQRHDKFLGERKWSPVLKKVPKAAVEIAIGYAGRIHASR